MAPLVFLRRLTCHSCSSCWDYCVVLVLVVVVGGVFLQLYAADEPDVRIGLFRKYNPPEELTIGDNYATFFFYFLHAPLLLNALLALSLNRWLDFQDGPQ